LHEVWCLRLRGISRKDRDEWIGGDAVTCANRLKLIVQLRRFAIIHEQRRPHLARQCLGLRELPAEWQRLHTSRPLLAESFHDPARHQGTLYKVANWISLGLTKGFLRHRAISRIAATREPHPLPLPKDNHRRLQGEASHFITSLRESDSSHARLAQIGRQHWSIENKNHWRKDATHWREDRSARSNSEQFELNSPLPNNAGGLRQMI
jgi:hypothetical protein